jgi:PAS domain S-box-containing protein
VSEAEIFQRGESETQISLRIPSMPSTLCDFPDLLLALENDESTIVTCYDSTGTVKYISLGVSRLLGFQQSQFVGNDTYELRPDEDSVYFRRSCQGSNVAFINTFRSFSPNGDFYNIEKIFLPISCVDVFKTGPRNDLDEDFYDVNDEATYLRDLIENSCMPVYSVRCDGSIMWANKAMVKMMGYENHVDEFIGSSSMTYHPDQNHALWMMERVLAGDALTECEATVRRRDGSLVDVIYNSNAYYAKDGSLKHTRCFLRDNTENIRLRKEKELLDMARIEEADLRAKTSLEASKLKSTFIATISHEIRTPINGMMGMSSLLNMTPLSAEQKDYVDTIMSSADILLSLIGNVLDVTKIESGKFELDSSPFNLSDLIRKTEAVVNYKVQEKKIDFSSHMSPSLEGAWLMGDANRVGQILINFLSNAIKFTHDGSVRFTITLVENITETKHSDITNVDGMDIVRFEVKDTGIGIEDCSTLFSPFVQAARSVYADYGGSGLGLSISRQLVTLMGGSVGIWSEGVAERGSTVWAEIPFKRYSPPHSPNAAKEPSLFEAMKSTVNNFGLRMLVVDDNKVNRKILDRMLRFIGYHKVDMAVNGKEAVDAVHNALRDGDEPYDVIFMDCLMPVMDGWEATRMIRRLESDFIGAEGAEDGKGSTGRARKPCTIWALTATVTVEDKQKSFISGMDDFLTKPISIEKLQKCVEELAWSGN